MDIGMLWFDNDPKADLKTKIIRAANYYKDKYGKAPNLCFVHPKMLPKDENQDPRYQGVEVRSSNTMLPNHFWIGVNQT